MSNLSRLDETQRNRLNESLRRNLGVKILGALNDPNVIEIMLNPDNTVWFDYLGRGMEYSGYTMPSSQAQLVLQDVASMLGQTVTKDNPVVEGELPLDGSRFEGLIPPIVAAPSFAIRKRASRVFTLDDYVDRNILTPEQAIFIRQSIRDKRNILVVGGTASGKTTLLNAFLDETAKVAPSERMVIIEDTVELQCPIKNIVQMRTSETMDMTKLLRVTMRMRPDRICVGEMRGKEALALLKAWNSGHSGGFATIHADSTTDALLKLDEYVQEAGVPSKMGLISRAVHCVVFIEKSEGGRQVKELARVVGYDRESNLPILEQV
ncbi:P-type conjugative transfer ATPase TrbB [Methylovorus glucosotrophus]|uniref:P-type conjugative transfer ATPase TrbB n=1 Tax=Methylovorus glucosotrophus (strain SIP3-4) TaxID=582744 RepID=C6XES5_METGS|nr:P-type conjugative transfer ATPase TrbB [Methylovorus glucosotrophus]ACT52132.1 P-type conjugative transfer ATPase TrbB [Methylovorus glucosotrophus SIP3-4]